jgi:catalytic LigB subunit of aromatic ring-opening dioxygenase
MAKIVFAFGSSHGPTIETRPENWDDIVARDMKDPRYRYEDLLRKANPALRKEITLEEKQRRWNAGQIAIAKIKTKLAEAKPDVAVVVSNPHGILPDDTIAVFGVFRGETLSGRTAPSTERQSQTRYSGVAHPPKERHRRSYKGYPSLAEHLIAALVDDGFDIASMENYRPELGVDDAFTCFYTHYQPDASTPMVPVMVSRYLPSQATPRRCFQFGQALRRAIDAWPENKRIALMASGGLSHQILDEELDHIVIDALEKKDFERLCTLPRDRLNVGPGTPETLNWVSLAAAMDPVPMTLVDYQPCYRSLAGTGHGVTFGIWNT